MSRICCFYTLVVASSISINLIGSSADARELLENGNFEEGGPFEVETGWNDGLGLGNDVGFATNRWPYFENGIPQGGNSAFELPLGVLGSNFTGLLRPIGAGDVFGRSWGAANGDGHSGSATQIVELGDFARTQFEFSAWLAGATDDMDYAIVSLEFFAGTNGTGTSGRVRNLVSASRNW